MKCDSGQSISKHRQRKPQSLTSGCGPVPIRSGAAVVELAVVLPVLLTIGMLTIDFGRGVSAYLVLANAARAGADYGATHHVTPLSRAAWEKRITSAIQSEMGNLSRYDAGKIQSDISTSNNSDGTTQVAVNVRYSLETIVPWPGVPATVPLRYRVEMRQYQ